MRNLPPLEDVDEESVFVISCTEDEMAKRLPPSVGDIEAEGAEILALINTGATVNVMDMSKLHRLKTRPIIRPTNARI